jgi:hypothetical protein
MTLAGFVKQALPLVLCALPILAAAESEPGIPPKTNLTRLLNRPEAIFSDVGSYREGENTWISMEADVQVCTDIPLEQLRKAITDYNNYAVNFKRTTASEILWETHEGTGLYLRLSVGALGITFIANYTILLKEEVNDSSRFLLRFSHLSDDGMVRNIHGYWYFQTVDIKGKNCTYVRYYSASDSIKKNALQKVAAAMFIDSEYTGMLKELLSAAKK